MTHDTWTLLMHSLPFLWKGACMTIWVSVPAIAIGLTGGVCIGIANCRQLAKPAIALVLDTFIWIVRGTPSFVQVLLAYYVLPEFLGFSLSPAVAGVIALGTNSIAYTSEIVRGSIDGVAVGQWEAAYALGLSTWKTLSGIILPQSLRLCLPSLINEIVALMKETSLLMSIGVCELTKISKDIVARELNPVVIYLAAAAIYLLMSSTLSFIATHIKWEDRP